MSEHGKGVESEDKVADVRRFGLNTLFAHFEMKMTVLIKVYNEKPGQRQRCHSRPQSMGQS